MPGVVEAVGEHWAAIFGVDLGNHWTHAGDVRVGVFDRGFGEDPTAKTEMCLGQRRASCPTAETSVGSWVPNTQHRFANTPLGSAARSSLRLRAGLGRTLGPLSSPLPPGQVAQQKGQKQARMLGSSGEGRGMFALCRSGIGGGGKAPRWEAIKSIECAEGLEPRLVREGAGLWVRCGSSPRLSPQFGAPRITSCLRAQED